MARGSDGRAEDDGTGHAGRRRGRPLKWAAAVLLVLLLAAVGAYWRWGANAERALDEAVDALRRRGEPVEAADLVRPPVPGAENAAIDLRSAAQMLDTSSGAWKAFEAIDAEEPPTETSRRSTSAVLETDAARKALALLRQARGRRGADWQIPMQSPLLSTLLPDVGDQRSLAKLARAAAEQARSRGDHAAAAEYDRDILGISRGLDRQGFLVTHLTAVAVSGMAARDAEFLRPASPEQLRLLVAELLDESVTQEAMRQGMHAERVLQLDTAYLLANRKLPLSAVMGASGGGKGAGIDHLPRALILSDAKLMLDFSTATLAALETSGDWPTYQGSAPRSPLPTSGGAGRHFVAGLLMPAYENAVKTHFHGLGDRRLAAAALALRCHASDHSGRFPQSLDELVPAYLPSVPLDPMAAGGKALRYVPAPHPLLYSVGDNGTDDGGSVSPINPRKQPMNRWDQQDAVFAVELKDP